MLDLKVTGRELQNLTATKKLQEALDVEFKYVGCGMSYGTFKNAIKGFLRTKRTRLKACYKAGDSNSHAYIN